MFQKKVQVYELHSDRSKRLLLSADLLGEGLGFDSSAESYWNVLQNPKYEEIIDHSSCKGEVSGIIPEKLQKKEEESLTSYLKRLYGDAEIDLIKKRWLIYIVSVLYDGWISYRRDMNHILEILVDGDNRFTQENIKYTVGWLERLRTNVGISMIANALMRLDNLYEGEATPKAMASIIQYLEIYMSTRFSPEDKHKIQLLEKAFASIKFRLSLEPLEAKAFIKMYEGRAKNEHDLEGKLYATSKYCEVQGITIEMSDLKSKAEELFPSMMGLGLLKGEIVEVDDTIEQKRMIG